VLKYGKYILISHHDLDLADRFFLRWGGWAVSSQAHAVVDIHSGLAGVSRMPVGQFVIFSFAGAFPGRWPWRRRVYTGENWEDLREWMRPADVPIAIILVLLAAWYVFRHVRRAWEAPQPSGPEA
jgi:membrane protein DedA with SNARE-associated domain